MTYLVDTDWVADYLKGRPTVVEQLHILSGDGLAISVITYGEIYEGIFYGTNAAHHARIFRQFLRGVDVLNFNRPIMQQFARIRGDLRRQGQMIGDLDTLIAATALHHDLTLIIRNRAHFERIPVLRLYTLGSAGR